MAPEPNNVCLNVESNFSIFIKTVLNYFLITAISLIAVFTILNIQSGLKNTSPVFKYGVSILTISLFAAIIGGLNPVAYDSIVIGVGICLGFMLFASVSGVDLLEAAPTTIKGIIQPVTDAAVEAASGAATAQLKAAAA